MSTHYSIIIQWSDEDQTYIVSLPEWGDLVHTHGNTYEEALKNGQELLQGLIEARCQHGEALPAPRVYVSA
jgi:antitoxin HicB